LDVYKALGVERSVLVVGGGPLHKLVISHAKQLYLAEIPEEKTLHQTSSSSLASFSSWVVGWNGMYAVWTLAPLCKFASHTLLAGRARTALLSKDTIDSRLELCPRRDDILTPLDGYYGLSRNHYALL
jgi:hypothetical protein